VKAKFIGDPAEPNAVVPDLHDAFGITFPRDRYVSVPKHLEDKIAGNNHFHVQGVKADAPEETAESTAEFATRIGAISDREGLEAMMADEKRPAARAVIERRLAELPEA
jgi:hypothetical protein